MPIQRRLLSFECFAHVHLSMETRSDADRYHHSIWVGHMPPSDRSGMYHALVILSSFEYG